MRESNGVSGAKLWDCEPISCFLSWGGALVCTMRAGSGHLTCKPNLVWDSQICLVLAMSWTSKLLQFMLSAMQLGDFIVLSNHVGTCLFDRRMLAAVTCSMDAFPPHVLPLYSRHYLELAQHFCTRWRAAPFLFSTSLPYQVGWLAYIIVFGPYPADASSLFTICGFRVPI